MKSRYKPPKLSQKETEKIYGIVADDIARAVLGVVLYVLHLRKWHKDKIIKFFNDVVSIINMPPAFGKYANDKEIRAFIETKYGIDFSKVHLNIESESGQKQKS